MSCLLVAASFGHVSLLDADDDLGIRAPTGFEVSLYAGDELAHDIYSMTVDAQGRIVVAAAGYIKTLHDDDGDGKAERAVLFSDRPKSGAHGMLCEGNTLYASGDKGIWKFVDKDRDGVADGEPKLWVDGLGHSEHGCNGIERGPDGWIYVICGNDAGVNEKFATTPDSPVTKPNCGAILRFSPDGQQSEILAHGFRNPYDLCFHPNGNIFTVDADGERDHHLPWYAPSRLFDVAIGMHHGWVLRGWQWSWNRPAYYFDNVERCAEIGRGSPTGMLCYRHTQFPQAYRGGIFSACWTLGRIYHFPLTPRGSTFDGKVDVFLETTGTTGFAPVDMVVGPDGSMYVAIGGRRTRGSVFRVRYVGPVSDTRREPENDLERVLDAPQPLSAWSRAEWLPLARKLKPSAFQTAALKEEYPTEWRVRAVEVLTEVHGALSRATAEKLIHDKTPEVAARAAWNVGRLGSAKDVAELLGDATKSDEPVVQRAAWEALIGASPASGKEIDADDSIVDERRIRAARIDAIARRRTSSLSAFPEIDSLWVKQFQGNPTGILHAQRMLHAEASDAAKLELMRIMVLGLGDIAVDPSVKESFAGYSLAEPIKPDPADRPGPTRPGLLEPGLFAGELAQELSQRIQEEDSPFNREAARLLAMLGLPHGAPAIEPISALLTPDSSPIDDIHYLMCLSRMPGERSEAARKNVAAGIALLDSKMKSRGWYPSRNWPDRVGETFAALAKHDPELPAAVIEHDAFKSPSQAFLFTRLEKEQQAAAARKLLKAVNESHQERWTSELVTLVAALPTDESLLALREVWDDFGVRDAILLQLAKSPQVADRERFVEALSSIDPVVIEKAAEALEKLAIKPSENDWLALMQSLRQSCSAPPAKAARASLAGLAAQWSGEPFEINEQGKGEQLLVAYQPWFDWFAKEHPALSKKLNAATGDAAAWKERLAKIDWSAGDVARGKRSYEQRNCVKCHAGNSPLGPDLNGAAGRFSKEDLIAAIVDPSKDVSPLYQATQIVTGSGRIYHGLVVYESPDGTLLTTGPDTTIRIAGDEIVSMAKSRLSLMPTGLLDKADDQEIADLVAYLQTLKGKR
jgi:putative membrane-bound dehydrogenase-like protein